jgi:hypothetical protein
MIAAAPRCAMTISRTLVHALKYQDRTDLAPAMGGWMARPRGTARQRRHADSSTAALAAGFRPPLQPVRPARARLHARSAWPWRVWCCAGCAGPNSKSGFARTAREQCAGRISGIRWPPGRRRGTARRLVDDVLTLGCDSGCLRASTFAGEGGHVDVLVFARVVDGPRSPIYSHVIHTFHGKLARESGSMRSAT